MITSIILGVVSALKREISLIVQSFQWLLSNCITIILDSFNMYYLRFSEVKHIADLSINRDQKVTYCRVIVITIAYAGTYFRNVRRSMMEQIK